MKALNLKELIRFNLKPFSFKHTEYFEQATNWDWSYELIANALKIWKIAIKVLNLFAYTGCNFSLLKPGQMLPM